MHPLVFFQFIYTLQTQNLNEQAKPIQNLPVNGEALQQEVDIPALIRQEGELAGLADWEIQRLTKICFCESTYRADAVNGQYKGLFQMGTHEFATYGSGDPFNPVDNIRAAINLYKKRFFQPWSCDRLIK